MKPKRHFSVLVLIVLFLILTVGALGEDSGLSRTQDQRWIDKHYGAEWIYEGSLKGRAGENTGALVPAWLPMCFLFDSSVDEKQANQMISSLASSYAACGISLRPYAFTIRANFPSDPKALGELAREACPFPSQFGTHGSVVLQSARAGLTSNMCQDPYGQGCSTLCEPVSLSFLPAAASVADVLHQSMHANCCGPLCVDEGQGLGMEAGTHLDLAPSEIPTVGGFPGPITAQGCQALRAGASASPIADWYGPRKNRYYTQEKNFERQIDLARGKNLLPSPPVAPAEKSLAGSWRSDLAQIESKARHAKPPYRKE